MSADDRMDTLLREAGARWREQNAEPVDVDFGALGSGIQPEDLVPIVAPGQPAPRRRHTAVWLATAVGIAAAVVAALVVIGGSGRRDAAPAAGPGRLVGVDWRLTAMADPRGTALEVVEPAPLRFDGGTVAGTDGCNHFSGPATAGRATVAIGALATTEIACLDGPAGSAPQGAHIRAVLTGTVRWTVRDGRLTLTGPAGTLVYTAVQHDASTYPRDLVDVTWRLTTVQRGTGPGGSASAAPPKAYLVFGSAGTVTGSDGCNALTGRAYVTAGRLTDVSLGGTYTLCPDLPDLRPLLSGTLAWTITDNRLTLTKPGTGALVFTSDRSPALSDPAALVGRTWHLTTLQDFGSETVSSPQSPLTLTLDGHGGLVLGHPRPCADLRGSAAVDAGTLTLGGLDYNGTTCDHVLYPDDDLVARILDGSVSWSITNGLLSIRKDGVGALFLDDGRSGTTAAPQGLLSVVWTHEQGGGEPPIRFVVDPSGRYTVTAGGCAVAGSASLTGGQLRLRPTSTPACASGVPFPTGTQQVSITRDTLRLIGPDGTEMVFTRR